MTWVLVLTLQVHVSRYLPSLQLAYKMPSCHTGLLQRSGSAQASGPVSAKKRHKGSTFGSSLGVCRAGAAVPDPEAASFLGLHFLSCRAVRAGYVSSFGPFSSRILRLYARGCKLGASFIWPSRGFHIFQPTI